MKKPLENKFEHLYWPQKLAGIDEAGRGPLCGPLTVACCVLPPFYQNDEINDSKKISERKREELYEQIVRDSLYWKVLIIEPAEIDRLNIYEATRQAMMRLANEAPVSYVLTDAMSVQCDGKTIHPLIHGDALSISIAAASILAKVTRDRIMRELDRIYPQYQYARHKGYPTKAHLAAMERYGLQPFYRFSYAPVARLAKNQPRK